MAEWGLSDKDLEDAMNLEKIFGWKKDHDVCCRCKCDGVTHIDTTLYEFSCSTCAEKHGGKRIGNESLDSYEMSKLEEKYGKGGKSTKKAAPAPPKKSAASPVSRSRTPAKKKESTRKRSPSPSSSESSEDEPTPKKVSKKKPAKGKASSSAVDDAFVDAFSSAPTMDPSNPGMLSVQQPFQASPFGAPTNQASDNWASPFGQQPFSQPAATQQSLFPPQPQQQHSFNSAPPSSSSALFGHQQAFGQQAHPSPFGFPSQQQSNPALGSLASLQAGFHQQPQVMSGSNLFASAPSSLQVPQPSNYASLLQQQRLGELMGQQGAKATNPFLAKLLPTPPPPVNTSQLLLAAAAAGQLNLNDPNNIRLLMEAQAIDARNSQAASVVPPTSVTPTPVQPAHKPTGDDWFM